MIQNTPVILLHRVVGPPYDLRLGCVNMPYEPPPQNDPYPNTPRVPCPACVRSA